MQKLMAKLTLENTTTMLYERKWLIPEDKSGGEQAHE
jgi:hypothetical protein